MRERTPCEWVSSQDKKTLGKNKWNKKADARLSTAKRNDGGEEDEGYDYENDNLWILLKPNYIFDDII